MTRVLAPQARCRAAMGRADITPLVGMYHRMWGAALHERSTGIHRPLTATALLLEAEDGSGRFLALGLDHCLFEAAETNAIKERIRKVAGLGPDQVHVALSHTHGSGWLSRSRAHLPGGDLIGPYFDRVAETCAELSADVSANLRPATIIFGNARCALAGHRDFPDPATGQFVCGFNPAGPADDTVLVAKVLAEGGGTLGTVVNYACHPTTLAWQNTLVSPDFVGAMREVVERETAAPCLFLQGASGDLGPRHGFVGDSAVADRNGRQLGFAALSGLEALPPAGTYFEYAGPVISGATLGTWEHRPVSAEDRARQATFQGRNFTVPLPYRVDLPTLGETKAELTRWLEEEARAKEAGDETETRDAHAHVERMNRQIGRLSALPAGKTFPYPVSIRRLGDSLWIFAAGELYQVFQTTLRQRFPGVAIVVATIADDWQPGYLPAAASYGHGIYQEVIAAVGPGSLEGLIEAVALSAEEMLCLGK